MALVEIDLVVVPGGRATIGSTTPQVERAVERWAPHLIDPAYTAVDLRRWLAKEQPAHTVEIASFALARHPVTQAQYEFFTAATGHRPSPSLGQPGTAPVWGVDHPDALAYCAWASDRLGRAVRLSTEAEWEWAARGPEHREFPWGDEFDPGLCVTAGEQSAPAPVGQRRRGRSWCGIEDLAGNVEEWTSSPYAPYPGGVAVDDDVAAANPFGYHVLRGGSCALGGDAARGARRHGPVPGWAFVYRGFRIAADLTPTPTRTPQG